VCVDEVILGMGNTFPRRVGLCYSENRVQVCWEQIKKEKITFLYKMWVDVTEKKNLSTSNRTSVAIRAIRAGGRFSLQWFGISWRKPCVKNMVTTDCGPPLHIVLRKRTRAQ